MLLLPPCRQCILASAVVTVAVGNIVVNLVVEPCIRHRIAAVVKCPGGRIVAADVLL
jgi:hypothetical protein